MLETIGVADLDTLMDQTVPADIRRAPLDLPDGQTEADYLRQLRRIADRNEVRRSYIGMGYHGTLVPPVIQRNLFENPAWYTPYTPYQAEIAQGRLESLLNFQTMVSDLTALPIANASLLDEGTAAAEAMAMFFNRVNKRRVTRPRFFVDRDALPQTKAVLATRAEPLGIELVTGDPHTASFDERFFGLLLAYPTARGAVRDPAEPIAAMREAGGFTVLTTDLLALTLLTPPGELGADCAVGNSQRFGVPMGYGGPHAAFFATTDVFKRQVPGRIIGLSVDADGRPALRMALQTREQHIRREKATSNICTAQALLANMAAMYAVYHGADGLRSIALRIHGYTRELARALRAAGWSVDSGPVFDTLEIHAEPDRIRAVQAACDERGINVYIDHDVCRLSIDETVTPDDLNDLAACFGTEVTHDADDVELDWTDRLIRLSSFLDHAVFRTHRSETQMMRYIRSLEEKDLGLVHSMIPLGSCTMKLNAAAELMPVSWPAFGHLHPFAPAEQASGYAEILRDLEASLCEITGFDAMSLQPNSGAQGEYSGLLVIRAYHRSNGDDHRQVVLIPESAHGTNPASAVMAGGTVVVVACDDHGNIDLDDLRVKATAHSDTLAALMITYPSTHGVFEDHIRTVCDVVHEHGGQVYMDGANMNAQIGFTDPAIIGADVCHLNLHKTFAIPHGGGGPGMGPIGVKAHLAPFLPGNPLVATGGDEPLPAISAAPWGSASILLISHAYIRMMGGAGLTRATALAVLNANYVHHRLKDHYKTLYTGGRFGRVAHELILDVRPFKQSAGIEVEDIAKRLMDYGFHAPTVSFPVPGDHHDRTDGERGQGRDRSILRRPHLDPW